MARVKDSNGKYGFIDRTGKLVISCQWKDARDFNDGIAYVQDDKGVWKFIDKTGKVVK